MLELLNEWGGVVGLVMGVLRPSFGSYRVCRNINGPKERSFAVKANLRFTPALLGLMLGLLFGLRYVLPPPHNNHWPGLLSVLGLLVALVVVIPILNRRRAQIRAEESQVSVGK